MIDILRDQISIQIKFQQPSIELTKEYKSKAFEQHYYRFYEQNNDEIAMISEFVLEDISLAHMEEIQTICETLYDKYHKKVNVYLLAVDSPLRCGSHWKKQTTADFAVNYCRC